MILGCHVQMCAPDYLLGAVNEALRYDANALMIYTGAPQNTIRKPISIMKVDEAKACLALNQIPLKQVIVHAPYIINLANSVNPNTYELSVSFLKQELSRVEEIGASYLVLHPGSHVQAGIDEGIKSIIKGLNEAMHAQQKVMIALETMSGKGSEIGFSFEQIQQIIAGSQYPEYLCVCMDTCHLHDAGYDLNQFDSILQDFDECIGLKLLKIIHINDSKNIQGAKKDRHANIGQGEIGFSILHTIVHHPLLQDVIKILETPYIEDVPPYREEIKMLKSTL